MLDAVQQFDGRLFLLLNNGLQAPARDFVFLALSELGRGWIGVLALLVLVPVGWRRWRRHLLVTVVCAVLAGLSNMAIKHEVKRERPQRVFQDEIRRGTVTVYALERVAHNGFPSGHSLTAFFFMVYLACYRRRHALWALPLAGLVALSRVYVGAHFPLDCVAGALLGSVWAWLAWRAFIWLDQHAENKGPTAPATAATAGGSGACSQP